MTNHDCLSLQEIGDVMGLPEGAPEREHVTACPRCSALLRTYQEFMEDRSVPPRADLKDAERSLRDAFAGAIPGACRPIRSVAPARGRSGAPSEWFRGGAWILAPAALVLAVGLYLGLERRGGTEGEERLRGPASIPADGAWKVVPLLATSPRVDGTVDLRWRSVESATSYEIVVFGSDLTDLARLSVGADTICALRRSDLRPEPMAGAIVGWQVTALRDGAIIGRSQIASAQLP
jgi:hypothetical protein